MPGFLVSAGSLAQDPAFPDAKNSAGSSARDSVGTETLCYCERGTSAAIANSARPFDDLGKRNFF